MKSRYIQMSIILAQIAVLNLSVWAKELPIATPTDAKPLQATDTEANTSEEAFIDAEMPTTTASDTILSEEEERTITGNLWEDWGGELEFQGDGSQEKPYQISTLSELMGLSESTAAGNSYKGTYFELTGDLDLRGLSINFGSWNPIGWYQNKEEMEEEVGHSFQGVFDGCGYTIRGLRIAQPDKNLRTVGLFGVIDGGEIRHLNIEADQVTGVDRAAVLAGKICGDAVIYDVTVSGCVSVKNRIVYGNVSGEGEKTIMPETVWKGSAGGITAVADGEQGRVTIENCLADGIIIHSEDPYGYVGGIVGQARNADLVDNTVYTQNGTSDRIQGRGCVGGISGDMDHSNIYNSYVDGTIGGNGTKAVGGIVGEYKKGNLILARFAGSISRTAQGAAAMEGTFIGTRGSRATFTYGVEKDNNLSYLFSNTAAKVKRVFGSQIDGDNSYTKSAHIGYWTDRETRYALVSGNTEEKCHDRYFYEELEEGIRSIITTRLGKEFTAEGAAKDLRFRLDHFAPGYQGEPIGGFLLSVPRIDTKNANGTYDTDVAVLTAMPGGNNSYYRVIDKDHGAAVAPGIAITVLTAPKNTTDSRYQMIMEESEIGGVKPPVYIDESGSQISMQYVSGGSYTFIMPQRDTEINVQYQKVTTQLRLTPEEIRFSVIHTRSGDRKNPETQTEVRDGSGILIARYLNGLPDTSVEIQPISIHGEHNQTGDTADRTMRWSVDDPDLLQLHAEAGYTDRNAAILPNLTGSFIQDILNREIQAQADSQYQETIKPTIYEKQAVVTAAANPAVSADNRAVYGNCLVTTDFQIIDQTTRRVEGLTLNHSDIMYTITRTLTGDRKHPTETFDCTEPIFLSASLFPVQPYYKNISWKDQESGQILLLVPAGEHGENCAVGVRYDAEGKSSPAWIQNVVQQDNQKKKEDPYITLHGSGSYTETVTAVSEDQTHGVVMAKCRVTIQFETVDKTVIYPEAVQITPDQIRYDLTVGKSGNASAAVVTERGFETQSLTYMVKPECPEDGEHEPYDTKVVWAVSDPSVLSVDAKGNITPQKGAAWIKEAMEKASAAKTPCITSKTVQVTATAINSGVIGSCRVTMYLTAQDNTYVIRSSGGGSSSKSSGGSSTGVTPAGSKTAVSAPKGSVTGTWVKTADGRWTFTSGGRTFHSEWAYIHNPYADAGKKQEQAEWFRFGETGHMQTGWFADQDGHLYYLNPVSDNTLGRMITGWNWITGSDGKTRCFYFNEVSDGTKGALLQNAVTPDGYQVNADGAWIINGVTQIKE